MNPVALGMIIGLGLVFGAPTLLLLDIIVVRIIDARLKRAVESVF